MKKTTMGPLVRNIVMPIVSIWIGRVSGLDNLPRNGAFIIAPNHCSYVEHFLLGYLVVPRLGKRLHILAKKEHFESPVQKAWHRIWIKYICYIPIDRSRGQEALKIAEKYLKNDAVLLLYPEGTRSLTGKIQEGKTGAVRLALWSKVPIVPVGIKGTFEILPKGKNIPRLKKADINFGRPICLDKYYNQKITKKLLRTLTTRLMKDIAALSGQKYDF